MRDLAMEDHAERGAPARIEHVREEIGEAGEIEEIYDYLIYTFAVEDGELTARVYTDEMHTISVMTRGPGGLPPEVPAEVEAWLRRRFVAVRVLGPRGYETLRRR